MVPRANTRCSPKPQGEPASSPLEARIVSSKPKSLFFRGRAFEDVDRGLSSCTDTNGLHCLTYQWLTLPNIPMAMAYTAADVLSMLYPYHLTLTYQPNNYSPNLFTHFYSSYYSPYIELTYLLTNGRFSGYQVPLVGIHLTTKSILQYTSNSTFTHRIPSSPISFIHGREECYR